MTAVPSTASSLQPPRPTPPWGRRTANHRKALANYMAIVSLVGPILDRDVIFDAKSGHEVFELVADELSRCCTVEHIMLEGTFLTVAQMSTLDPETMVAMLGASSWQRLCMSIPRELLDHCDPSVRSATMSKPTPATSKGRQPITPVGVDLLARQLDPSVAQRAAEAGIHHCAEG